MRVSCRGMEVIPLSPALGAEIRGVDAASAIAHAVFRDIEKAWHDHLVIVLRDQALDETAQVRFAERFGELSPIHTSRYSETGNPAIMYVGNRQKDGKIIGALPVGEMQFHSDQCYQARPAAGTMLYAIEIPAQGGNTLFANGYKALAALPAHIINEVEGRKALNVYSYDGGVLARSDMVSPDRGVSYAHPVVRTHPATGRRSLYVNRLMTHHIEGLPVDESRDLLQVCFETLERPEFVYEHRWHVGDVLLWDNRCTLHARRDFDPNERRWMRRVTIQGDSPR
jgi:taurine dioxygenase